MSMSEMDHWKCDRCGVEEETRRGYKPTAWAHADVRFIDRGGSREGNDRVPVKTGHLCSDCRLSFLQWWAAGA